jgi:hypothetical protein
VSPARLEDCCNGAGIESCIRCCVHVSRRAKPTPLSFSSRNKKSECIPSSQEGYTPVRKAILPFADLPHPSISHPYDITPAPQLHYSTTVHDVPWSSISFPTTQSILRSFLPMDFSAIGSARIGPYRRFGRVAPSSSDQRLTPPTTRRLSGKSPGAGSAGTLLSTVTFSGDVQRLRAARPSR